MGKKRQRKGSSDSFNASSKSSVAGDQSHLKNESLNEIQNNPYAFKILLCKNSEDKDKYYNWTKSCTWKNIAFIHPSVLLELHIGAYLFAENDQNRSIFITYPLKTVGKSSVVFLHDMGFKHQEFVNISSFDGEGYEAEKIFVLPANFEITDSIKDVLLKNLSNRFLWPGITVNFDYFGTKYEFIISNITTTGKVSHQNFSRDVFNRISYSNLSNLSSDERYKKTEPNLSAMMSSVNLQDSLNSSAAKEDSSHVLISKFFTTSYRTLLYISDDVIDTQKCVPLFKHIGGYKKNIESIKEFIHRNLTTSANKADRCHLLLLVGPLGTGKTMMLKAVLNEFHHCSEEINITYLLNKNSSEAIKEITKPFKQAKRRPSILIVDEFDRLYPPVKGSLYFHIQKTFQTLIAACNSNTIIIASISTDSNYEEELAEYFLVERIKFSLPSCEERDEILQRILSEMKHDQLQSSEIKRFAQYTEGMTGVEMFNALKYTGLLSRIRERNTLPLEKRSAMPSVSFEDMMEAIRQKKSQIMSSNMKSKKVLWSDIGGMNAIKEKFKEQIKLIQLPPEIKKHFNYQPPRGILLYGPPGCSKTMIAKALATEFNWNFISKKSSELFNMYVGDSEKAISDLFREARSRTPCIIFLDEIDALAPNRSSFTSSSGVGSRIVSTLLTEMDGFEALNDVMVVSATNRPDIIDPALLRAGRIGLHIYVPLPDSCTRKEIFKISMKRRCVHEEVHYDDLVQKTEGYNGAEIVNLCNEAAMQLLLEDPECESPVFKMKHFEEALIALPPRTDPELIKCYENFHANKT